MAFDRVGAQIKRINLAQPGVLIGRKYTVGRTALGQYFTALENRVVLAGVKSLAQSRQRRAHPGIPCECLGFVVVVGKNGVHVQRSGQRRNLVFCDAVAYDQSAIRAPAQCPQVCIEFHHGASNEVHPQVGAGEGVEN